MTRADGWGDEPTVLIFGDTERHRALAQEAAESVGARVIGTEPIVGALDRLSRQVAVDSVMIELDGREGTDVERLIDWANYAARQGIAGTMITLPQTLIDQIYSRVEEPGVVLLCAPEMSERVANLGMLLAGRKHKLHDQGVEADAERLRRLSEEVARIAGALADLSTSARSISYAPVATHAGADGNIAVGAAMVRSLIRVRRLRDQFFAKDLFADPAWDMLLDLMAARFEQSRVSVSSLCIAAAVPPTTALRWIRTLTEHGLFLRKQDPEDGRRIFIELSDAAADALTAYLQTTYEMGFRTPQAV